MNEANVKLVERGFEAFAAGDMETMSELLSPDIVWHSPGNNPISGTYTGLEEVFGLFAKVGELTGGQLTNDLHAVLADDEHAVALVSASARRGDKTLDAHSVFVYHIANGRVTEAWLSTEDQAAADEFWS